VGGWRSVCSLWDDVLWPLLAGLVTAAGVLCAHVSWGPVWVGTTFFSLGLGLMPLAWTVGEASGRRSPVRAVATLAPTWAVGVLAVVGLSSALRGWWLLLPLTVVLSAPWIRTRTARTGHQVSEAVQRARTRWEFHQIITHGG
jgi:hypothetical protein